MWLRITFMDTMRLWIISTDIKRLWITLIDITRRWITIMDITRSGYGLRSNKFFFRRLSVLILSIRRMRQLLKMRMIGLKTCFFQTFIWIFVSTYSPTLSLNHEITTSRCVGDGFVSAQRITVTHHSSYFSCLVASLLSFKFSRIARIAGVGRNSVLMILLLCATFVWWRSLRQVHLTVCPSVGLSTFRLVLI